jgi:large subunit ribosomal protein L30
MGKVKLTQIKSGIDRSKRQKNTLIALGLRRIDHSVVKEVSPQIEGMIKKVEHLIKIEAV